MAQVFIVEELIGNEWVPAIGGGSSAIPHVRAFEKRKDAERALHRINYFRGLNQLPLDTKRRVTAWNRHEQS
ncbi:MAG: hypothetical protein ABF967_11345 [Lacticaseibacillus paracasei]